MLEFIKADIEIPSGVVIFEDPPLHDVHRGLLSRVFTPKKMEDLEPKVRALCRGALDPHVGAGRFDFVADLGEQLPMRTIGMLLGVPESAQEAARDRAIANLRTEPGKPMEISADNIGQADFFADYVDWRMAHPSDDLMTELIFAEFEDETGAVRRLTRDEVLIYVSVLSSAGNETTNRLIGWMGKVLAEEPEQRRLLVSDRSLVPNAIEELLRFESPTPHVARYVTKPVELHGETLPAGSAMLCLSGSANRDERRFDEPDRFDVRRKVGQQHFTFGRGIHYCLGAALARLEGRIALDEVLTRFPVWEVDWEHARRAPRRRSTVGSRCPSSPTDRPTAGADGRPDQPFPAPRALFSLTATGRPLRATSSPTSSRRLRCRPMERAQRAGRTGAPGSRRPYNHFR